LSADEVTVAEVDALPMLSVPIIIEKFVEVGAPPGIATEVIDTERKVENLKYFECCL